MGYKSRGSHKKFTAKGRSRYIATFEEVAERNKDLLEEEDKEDDEHKDHPSNGNSNDSEENEEEDSSESEYEPLIEISNPNKTKKQVEKTGVVELSRREREELKRQKFEREKMKLMAEGKLASAKADLERLAKIRKEREEAMARKLEKMKLTQNS